MDRTPRHVLEQGRANAAAAWLLIAVLAGIAVESWLDADLLWAGVSTVILGLALLPPLRFRRARVMVPWEVLLVGVLPVFGWAWDAPVVTAPAFMHLAVGAAALIVTVELDAFTRVRMTDRFAVALVVLTTIAGAGLLALGQWYSDVLLGTAFLTSHDALMQGFTAATGAGIFAGVLYRAYFRRLARRGGAPGAHP